MVKTINLRDLPEELVRKAKAVAALHGMTLRDFVLRAVEKAIEEDIPASSAMPMAAITKVEGKRRAKR